MISRKSVMVVDDDPGIRCTMSDVLKYIGCDVDVASNGIEAVAAERDKHHEIILMDVHMPGMNGIDAYNKIKVFNKTSRIVFVTANTDNGDRKEMERTGCIVLEKPVNWNQLSSIIFSG